MYLDIFSVLSISIKNGSSLRNGISKEKNSMNNTFFFFFFLNFFLLLTVTVNSQRKFSHQHFLCRKLHFCTSFYGPHAKTRCYSTRCHWTTPFIQKYRLKMMLRTVRTIYIKKNSFAKYFPCTLRVIMRYSHAWYRIIQMWVWWNMFQKPSHAYARHPILLNVLCTVASLTMNVSYVYMVIIFRYFINEWILHEKYVFTVFTRLLFL